MLTTKNDETWFFVRIFVLLWYNLWHKIPKSRIWRPWFIPPTPSSEHLYFRCCEGSEQLFQEAIWSKCLFRCWLETDSKRTGKQRQKCKGKEKKHLKGKIWFQNKRLKWRGKRGNRNTFNFKLFSGMKFVAWMVYVANAKTVAVSKP